MALRFFGEPLSDPLPASSPLDEILRFFFLSACIGLPDPDRRLSADFERERDRDRDFDVLREAGEPLLDLELHGNRLHD